MNKSVYGNKDNEFNDVNREEINDNMVNIFNNMGEKLKEKITYTET